MPDHRVGTTILSMSSFTRVDIVGPRPHSLLWQGDHLVDWAGGGRRYFLDGTASDPAFFLGYPFDAAVGTGDGEYVVVYQRLGTKGLLMREGQILRELNRSYYFADAYEYPVALTRRRDGRVLLAHCPDDYNRLELEDAQMGERLTTRTGEAADFFHSRLRFSPSGTRLLSAGWIWQPWDALAVFEVETALTQPDHLNTGSDFAAAEVLHETRSADFLGEDTLVVAADPEGNGTAPTLLPSVDLHEGQLLNTPEIPAVLGTIWALEEGVLALHNHPRLYDWRMGALLAGWPDLDSGQQQSSVIHHIDPPAPFALDRAGRRFALGTGAGVTVVSLGS